MPAVLPVMSAILSLSFKSMHRLSRRGVGGRCVVVSVIRSAFCHADSAFRLCNEVEQDLCLWARKSHACVGERLGEIAHRVEEHTVETLQLRALLQGKTCTPQPPSVEPSERIAAEARHRKGRQILADARATLHERQRADAAELMNEAVPRNKRAVLHCHMACQKRAIGNDDVVSELAIMRDVAMRHEEIM